MNPINFGKKYLVEDVRKIDIKNFLKIAKQEFKKFIINSSQEINNIKIDLTFSNTGFGGLRIWFICPSCQKRVGILYQDFLTGKIACRKCNNLDYKSHLK